MSQLRVKSKQDRFEFGPEDWTESSMDQVKGVVVPRPFAFAEGAVSCNCNFFVFLFIEINAI
jgi:hypothetical protein